MRINDLREAGETNGNSRGHGKLERPWETREAMGNSRAALPRRGKAAKKFFEKGEVLIKFIIFANVIDKIVIYYLLYINLYS